MNQYENSMDARIKKGVDRTELPTSLEDLEAQMVKNAVKNKVI
jgi:hypothetical protein